MSKFIDVLGITIFFGACVLFLLSSNNTSINSQSDLPSKPYTNRLSDEDYNIALNLAKQGKWQDCAGKLVQAHNGDDRAKVLYAYAQAQQKYEINDFKMAQYYLKNIPDNYSGNFSEPIKQMKTMVLEKVIQQEANQKQAKVAAEKEKENHIYIGDPEEKIRKVFGEPDKVNRHVNSSTVTKQYVYYYKNKMVCVYTENGIVTDFQD